MGEPIKIVVTAETAAAAAQLQTFLHQNIDGLTQVERVAAGAAAKTSEHMGGMVYQFRASMDAIRYAAMDGGPRAAFYAVDEAIRGLVSSGLTMGRIVPVLGGIGAAAGGAYLAFHALTSEYAQQIARNNELTESFTKQAEAIKTITEAAKGGAISGDERTQLLGMLGLNVGQQKFPLAAGAPQGEMNAQASVMGNAGRNFALTGLGLPDATRIQEVNQELAKLNVLLETKDEKGKITYTINPEIQSLAELTQLREKYNAQMELDFDKQRARAAKQHDEELRNLDVELAKAAEFRQQLQNQKQAHPEMTGDINQIQSSFSAAKLNDSRAVLEQQYQDKLAAIDKAELAKRASEMEAATRQTTEAQSKLKEVAANEVKAQIESVEQEITARQQQEGVKRGQFAQQEYQERTGLYAVLYYSRLMPDEMAYTKLVQEAAHKRADAQKEYTEELKKELELKHALAQAEAEAQIKQIKDNPFLNTEQKQQQSVAPLQTLMATNASTIGDLQNSAATDPNSTTRLEALQKVVDLQSKQVDLQHQLDEAVNADNFVYQWQQAAVSLQTFTTLAQESANAFKTSWEGAENSVSGGLTHLFMYGAQRGQWFVQMWNGMCESLISSFTKVVVHWVAQHLLMLITHQAGETQMTAATMMGTAARNMWHMMETIWHGICTAIRVAVHVAGEALCTAATYAGAILRAMYHAIVAAIAAIESLASVPYVGVILGIAAGAAVMAAAMGMMGGFQEGGYTGDGSRDQIAGVVHAGEFVMPAHAVQSIGIGNLEAMRQGGSPSSAAVAAGVGKQPPHKIENSIYFDSQKMIDHLQSSDAHEKYVVDVMRRNIHKFR